MTMQTIYDLIRLAADRTPDRVALVDDKSTRHLTYRELLVEVNSIAGGMLHAGIKPGRPVLTALPNLFEHCLAVLALQRLGVVVALANPRLPPAQQAKLADLVDAQAVIVLDDDEICGAFGGRTQIWRVGNSPAANFADCQASAALLPDRPRPKPEEPAFILFTSGTTGQPKPVVLPHRATEPRMNWMTQLAGIRPDPHLKTLGAAPIFHAIGFFGCFLFTLSMGGTYYTMSAFDPAAATRLVRTHRLTLVFLVPTMFQAIVADPSYHADHFASVRHAIYGGGPIDPRLLRRLSEEWPAEWTNAYGTTEIMVPLYHDQPLEVPRELKTAVGWQTRVIKIGGTPHDSVAVGETGELIFNADNDSVFLHYLDNPSATDAKVRNGWYYSGDLARRNAHSVQIVGRCDDMIRSGSETIYPEEIETALLQHEAVADVCVVGLPDEYWGERVVACIVRRDAGLTSAAIDSWLRQLGDLADYKRPKGICFLDKVPRNAMNKIDRRMTRTLAAARDDSADSISEVA
jgi:acyl-CoA synthetase (AMP-forming)/AMP-acid ligase II